jgi:predicted membrane-bound spermidine synthase
MSRAARVDVNRMNRFTRRVLFLLFFLSGFCSLVYQVVWTRMAFASFGIITPVLSVVLSVFMLGLAVGSWAGGRFIASMVEKTGLSAVAFYGGAEFLIGLGAFEVPRLFALGERILLTSGETDSFRYLSLSALVLAASILPWCVCMGATFPLMMAYIREQDCHNTKSFSFLYLANVLGAMCGTFLTAMVLVELLGFRHTLWEAAAGNFTIAFISGCLAWEQRRTAKLSEKPEGPARPAELLRPPARHGRMTKMILFSTGFVAMAMEVVWTRAFTPVLKTQVYSFALIVFTYLGATFIGSWVYRRDLRKHRLCSTGGLISALAITALLPVLANNPQFVATDWWSISIDVLSAIILLGSICPFCALLGYLTPSLIDEHAAGHPTQAGQAYAINVLGCILGPLFAGYVLLPHLSERYALILLGLPFLVFWFFFFKSQLQWQRWGLGLAAVAALTASLFLVRDFETVLLRTQKNMVVRRDYAATVISFGEAHDKRLLVNGIGMTILTPITKFMVHLPLAFHQGKPESALVICFGMGTSYRSALSWDIDTTTVELVPSVTKAFGFYHADAARVLNNPKGRIIIDDGRRYLKRTAEKFDVIVIDPPPPVEAAGSSLLYSKEFYELAKQHLKPGGILQMWFPGGEVLTDQAVIRSINESFPHVRCFLSVAGWGNHILASSEPIEQLDANQLVARMPESAKKDLVEWNDSLDVPAFIGLVVTNEASVPGLLNSNLNVQITDDRPYNEYFLLRRLLH